MFHARIGSAPLPDGLLLVRYDIRPDATGWTVFDTVTGAPAKVEDVAAELLSEDEAAEIADLLNTLAFLRRGSRPH